MKAVVYRKYGSPDELRLEEVPRPSVSDGHVLVRVLASSINSWDWDLLRGRWPREPRSLVRPRIRVLGADVAGRVEAAGSRVTRFRPGDEVYGDISRHGWGGFGEYVSVPAEALAPKPPDMTFEQAAAIPQAAGLALQGLLKGGLRRGHTILLNGAGGGVGTFAIQMAKAEGAEVVAVDHTAKLDAMRSLGADRVLDYTKEDFTGEGQTYDLILDVVASRSIAAYRRSLRPGGRYVIVGGAIPAIARLGLIGPLVMTGGRKGGVLVYRPSADDLTRMNELFASGKVVPVIDSTYPLAGVPEAMRRFGEGGVVGKVVIRSPTRGSLPPMWRLLADPGDGRSSSARSSSR